LNKHYIQLEPQSLSQSFSGSDWMDSQGDRSEEASSVIDTI